VSLYTWARPLTSSRSCFTLKSPRSFLLPLTSTTLIAATKRATVRSDQWPPRNNSKSRFVTFVGDAQCSSACAVARLDGFKRYMTANSEKHRENIETIPSMLAHPANRELSPHFSKGFPRKNAKLISQTQATPNLIEKCSSVGDWRRDVCASGRRARTMRQRSRSLRVAQPGASPADGQSAKCLAR
jgi:hypothetical protein